MHAAPAPAAVTRPVRLLVLHCSATASGQWLAGPPGTAQYSTPSHVIDGWHAARGFHRADAARAAHEWRLQAIGYHAVIDLDGTVWPGRHLNEAGAHVQGFNRDTVGICLVGGAERDARYTAAQWQALAGAVADLCTRLGIPAARPLYPRHDAGVCGHRDLSPDTDGDGRITPAEWLKTCPGFDVGAWLARGMKPLPEQVCAAAGGAAA